MKKFTKGNIETVVEDDDRRIPEYKANGWKEVPLTGAPDTDEAALNKALGDVQESEKSTADKGKGKSKGKNAKANTKSPELDKKVNEAVEANSAAAAESGEVDDGLENKEE